MGEVVSLGSELIWTGSDAFWRLDPSVGKPELLIRATSDNPIVAIAGSSKGYVFQTRERIGGSDPSNHWRLWFLAAPGATPSLLDQYDNDRSPDPSFAINADTIVWTAFHGEGAEALSTLRLAELDGLDKQARDLMSYPALDASVWLPVLNGDELWYGVSRNDWSTGSVYPRIEMVDLANPAAAPIAYGSDVRAFMPAVTDQVVAWKGGGADDLAAFNAGQLFIYWRNSGAVEPIAIPGGSWDRISFPSVGNRFVSWWDELDTHFFLYDLEAQETRLIAEYEPTGKQRILRPSLTDNLLAFIYVRGERFPQQIRWASLPD
jgi:hypothetical protein